MKFPLNLKENDVAVNDQEKQNVLQCSGKVQSQGPGCGERKNINQGRNFFNLEVKGMRKFSGKPFH